VFYQDWEPFSTPSIAMAESGAMNARALFNTITIPATVQDYVK